MDDPMNLRRDAKEIEILGRVIDELVGVDVREHMGEDKDGQYLDLGSRGIRLAMIRAKDEQLTQQINTERGDPAEQE